MQSKYILIDWENVHLDCSQPLVGNQFKILVFVGANQSKLPVEIVQSLQPLGSQVEYIRISGSGSNALDFHIAYYIGKISQSDPSATFRIVSNDKGFDPLIEHLNSRNVDTKRIESPKVSPSPQAAVCGTAKQRFQAAVSFLQRVKSSKPRTIKTLHSALSSSFRKQLSDTDIKQVVKQLLDKGHVIISEDRLDYVLPDNRS